MTGTTKNLSQSYSKEFINRVDKFTLIKVGERVRIVINGNELPNLGSITGLFSTEEAIDFEAKIISLGFEPDQTIN